MMRGIEDRNKMAHKKVRLNEKKGKVSKKRES